MQHVVHNGSRTLRRNFTYDSMAEFFQNAESTANFKKNTNSMAELKNNDSYRDKD